MKTKVYLCALLIVAFAMGGAIAMDQGKENCKEREKYLKILEDNNRMEKNIMVLTGQFNKWTLENIFGYLIHARRFELLKDLSKLLNDKSENEKKVLIPKALEKRRIYGEWALSKYQYALVRDALKEKDGGLQLDESFGNEHYENFYKPHPKTEKGKK